MGLADMRYGSDAELVSWTNTPDGSAFEAGPGLYEWYRGCDSIQRLRADDAAEVNTAAKSDRPA